MTTNSPDQLATIGTEAVRAAMRLTTAAQGRLAAGDVLTKGDDSPVTVADFGAQAMVCAVLTDRLGDDVAVVGEESADDLADRSELLAAVTELVGDARRSGDGTSGDVTPDDIVRWIGAGSADASTDRYWTLDPIDGTKGFLRGDQYAIALALIEDGAVTIGVLGCPNLPNGDGSHGALFVATPGAVAMYVGDDLDPRPVSVDTTSEVSAARFCESVETGHSDQGWSSQIAVRLGITTEPYRIDSQCKYAAVARGDASIYLRLPTRADYVEKIWDHAAGKFVVEQAGGRVTDIDGNPLDFSRGARLDANRGVVATNARFHDEVIAAINA